MSLVSRLTLCVYLFYINACATLNKSIAAFLFVFYFILYILCGVAGQRGNVIGPRKLAGKMSGRGKCPNVEMPRVETSRGENVRLFSDWQ